MWPKSSPLYVFLTIILALILFCGWSLKKQSARRRQNANNGEQFGVVLLLVLLLLSIVSIGAFICFLLPWLDLGAKLRFLQRLKRLYKSLHASIKIGNLLSHLILAQEGFIILTIRRKSSDKLCQCGWKFSDTHDTDPKWQNPMCRLPTKPCPAMGKTNPWTNGRWWHYGHESHHHSTHHICQKRG